MNELELLVHQQPHNAEAEERLIASCLLPGDTSVYDTVKPMLEAEDFYTLRCKLLYQAIGELTQAGKPLNEVAM